ncbi:hypothetical protein M0R45_001029 [Rubus argutus]|uniref:Uncharacterized protein n=1 Tax=Rubus argutus TaxID=59490 RepID=A0AAW1VMR8_RUBAR
MVKDEAKLSAIAPLFSHHFRRMSPFERSDKIVLDSYVVGGVCSFSSGKMKMTDSCEDYSNTRAYIQVLLLQGRALRGATLNSRHRSDYKDIGNLFLILYRAELLLHLYSKFTADTFGSHRSRFTFSSENSSFKNPP